ncbi:MAG: peptide chain release factor-like protein [Phycisphaerae bacterium]|nr:peptide chain release factor-like protein [Phycisphaerae bacterium]
MNALHEYIYTPPPHPAALAIDVLLAQCDWGRGRGTGPGGQHRNKVETLVWITHTPTGIESHAGERRSAEENKRMAVTRLRLALAVRVRVPVPIGEVRSDLWLRRCPDSGTGIITCNPEHADYPALLAEAMDVIHACGEDIKRAALRLSCSMSQLVKLLKDHPPALVRVNERRESRGLHPMR